jgi:hypothetical protein
MKWLHRKFPHHLQKLQRNGQQNIKRMQQFSLLNIKKSLGTHRYITHCRNFASFELFWIRKYTLVYINLQLRTRKVLDILLVYVLFYKYSSSKCKQSLNCLYLQTSCTASNPFARILKAHSHSMSGSGSIWASLECQFMLFLNSWNVSVVVPNY